MKRIFLFLMIMLVFQISCKITPVLTQEDEVTVEIKKVLEGFLNGFALRELETTMKYVSVNYSDTADDGTVIDYAKYKAGTEKVMNNTFKRYIGYSYSDLKILKSDIQDNKATLEIEFSWKGYNFDTLKENSGKEKRSASLAKENGS